jgi:hypothetical protein
VSVFEELLTRTPVNSTAAKVTQQSGVDSDELEEIEGLRIKAKHIQSRILGLPKGSRQRDQLCTEFGRISKRIGELRPVSKRAAKLQHESLPNYIIEVVKEEVTRPEFERYVRIAKQRMEDSRE